jgi:hypothetical protein
MTSKMNWQRARFVGKPLLDWRRELDLQNRDPAARWLQRAESRQQGRRQW